MAIFHLTATLISRARGQSAVAAAAYRSCTRLRDERYGITHHYLDRHPVAHAEIMAPVDAPAWVHDREALWNGVELAELRKDSQLARVIEVGLPLELTPCECLALLRDYIAAVFVSDGMIADFCIRRDNPDNPHAQVLLTLRDVSPSGFGRKARRWNARANLVEWRAAWAEFSNEHLALAGATARIDHRTLEAQQIELTPARRMGVGRAPRNDALPSHLSDRIAEQRLIAHQNGEAMREDPTLALRTLTHQRSSFTLGELARYLRPRTDGIEQYDAVYQAVMHCDELVPLQPAADQVVRFTSRDMIDAAKSLLHRTQSMAARRRRTAGNQGVAALPTKFPTGDSHARVFRYLMSDGDAKALLLAPDVDHSRLLTAARETWEGNGLRVVGTAVGRRAAQRLQAISGIGSRPVFTYLADWSQGRELPTRDTVLIVDATEMLGLKALERVVAVADKARASLVLLGNKTRVQVIEAELPFREVWLHIGLPDE